MTNDSDRGDARGTGLRAKCERTHRSCPQPVRIVPALIKAQHQCHLLPEASLIPRLEKSSLPPRTSQPSVHFWVFMYIFYPLLLQNARVSGEQNLLCPSVSHVPQTEPGSHEVQNKFLLGVSGGCLRARGGGWRWARRDRWIKTGPDRRVRV